MKLIDLRFCYFWECFFETDKLSQFNKDTLSKEYSAMEVLRMCLPYVKKYCQRHQCDDVFFRAQINSDSIVFWKLVLERSKMTD